MINNNQLCEEKFKNSSIAIFDFDGTIIPADLTKEFLKWQISNSVLRCILCVFVVPIVGLLILNKANKVYVLNVLNIIATCCCRKSIFTLRHQFLDYYVMRFPVVVHNDAIERINKHKKDGVAVVILSASPTWLLYGFLKKHNIKPDYVVGSKQQVLLNSLVTTNFCYGENKVRMAEDAGLNPSNWTYGYTDSPEDIPFLGCCLNKTAINIYSKRVKRKFKRCFHENIKNEFWT